MTKIYYYAALLAATMSVTACQDYAPEFSPEEIRYKQEFKKMFGEIDPQQDWNLASRASVQVTVGETSQVRIYALNADKYQIVGDYSNVSGTQTLSVDVLEGISELMVTDGNTAVKTTVGGSVSFGSATRSLYPGTYGDGDIVAVSGSDGERKIFTRQEVQAWNTVLPEIAVSGESNGLSSMQTHKLCNLNKVTKDFLMVSTGTFYLYPLFYLTNQINTVGIYIKEGNTFKYAPLYTIRSGDELQTGNWGDWYTINGSYDDPVNRIDYDYAANGYTNDNFTPAVWTEYTAPDGTSNGYVGGNFYKYNSTSGQYEWQSGGQTLQDGTKFKTLTTLAQTRNYVWANVGYSMANTDGSLPTTVDKVRSRPIKVTIPEGTVFGFYLQLGGSATSPTPTFYSQSELNSDMDYVLAFDSEGIVDPSNTTLSSTKHACHVVNFEIDGTTYLGFEDWTNTNQESDMDFNDVMMVISGAKPTVIDEDPTTASWVLACEDLGNSFDTDYNDVVFRVEHVSGRTTATVTPLAAGGTLASHVFFNSQDLGEIHQMFGAAPQNSGSYSPINVGSSRGNAGHQKTITVDKDFTMTSYQVGESNQGNANMGGFSVKVLPSGAAAGSNSFGEASVVSAPSVGKIPEIICLPYSYTVEDTPTTGKKTTYTWAWSQELKTLAAKSGVTTYGAGSYPEFANWVNDHNSNTDWYMHPTEGLTVAESKVVEDMAVGGGDDGNGGNSDPYIANGYSKLTQQEIIGGWKRGFDLSELKSAITSGNVEIVFVASAWNNGCTVHLGSSTDVTSWVNWSFSKVNDTTYSATKSISELTTDYIYCCSANAEPTMYYKAVQ